MAETHEFTEYGVEADSTLHPSGRSTFVLPTIEVAMSEYRYEERRGRKPKLFSRHVIRTEGEWSEETVEKN